jgi:hypothetical protein
MLLQPRLLVPLPLQQLPLLQLLRRRQLLPHELPLLLHLTRRPPPPLARQRQLRLQLKRLPRLQQRPPPSTLLQPRLHERQKPLRPRKQQLQPPQLQVRQRPLRLPRQQQRLLLSTLHQRQLPEHQQPPHLRLLPKRLPRPLPRELRQQQLLPLKAMDKKSKTWTHRFAKLMFPMFGLCIVSLTILVSFSVVNNNTLAETHNNYYILLDEKEAALQNKLKRSFSVENMRDLAMAHWQNNKIEDAEPLLRELWEEHNSANTTIYDKVFVDDGLNLAGLYLDRGSNVLAKAIYERLIAYDGAHLKPLDPRLGRDFNNLGLCFLQMGQAEANFEQRRTFFDKAVEQCSVAEKIFKLSPGCEQQLVCSMQNQVVAYSELGQDDKALELSNLVNKRLDSWHEKIKLASSDKNAKSTNEH